MRGEEDIGATLLALIVYLLLAYVVGTGISLIISAFTNISWNCMERFLVGLALILLFK